MQPTILVTGDFVHDFYEPEFCTGLRSAGAAVIELPVRKYLGPGDLLRRAQTKFVFGPGILAANAALVATCARHRPDCVLAWRTPWLTAPAIELCRQAGARAVVLYNNDDPFGPDRDLRIWRSFRRLIPAADVCFSYRPANIEEYRAAGAQSVYLLRSGFSPRLHFRPALTRDEYEQYACDVSFVGHCANDERLDLMDHLLASRLRVKIFGAFWERYASGRRWEKLLPIPRLPTSEYVKAMAAAKVGLVFLSGRNRDQYTRRCFEIPAIGTLMLAPRTPELCSLFKEEEEAAFYSSADELVAQAERYCSHDDLREMVAAAGHRRCMTDGHDVDSRAKQFLAVVQDVMQSRRRNA